MPRVVVRRIHLLRSLGMVARVASMAPFTFCAVLVHFGGELRCRWRFRFLRIPVRRLPQLRTFARIAPYCHASFSSAPGLRELVVAAEDRSARLRHAFVSTGAYRWPSSLRLLVRLFSPFCTLESALPVNITVLPSCRSVSNLESLGGVS